MLFAEAADELHADRQARLRPGERQADRRLAGNVLQCREWNVTGDRRPCFRQIGLKEIAGLLRASPRHCQASSRIPFGLGRSAAHSFLRRRGSRSIPIGAPIHFVPIAWRGRSPRAAERQAAGLGGSEMIARMDCHPHSERHQRPIGNAHTRRVRDSAVYAGNQFIASAGMRIYGMLDRTKTLSGTAPAWSHGNFGTHQVVKCDCYAASRRGVAAKPAAGSGRLPRLTTASHCFGSGTSTGMLRGRSCSVIGVCRTFR